MAPLPVAPAGLPANQGSKPQPPNTCTYSLKCEARVQSWDRQKTAWGAQGAHARTYTPVPSSARGCARQTYRATQRPRGSAHTDLRQRPGAGNLGSWAVHAAARPLRAAARRSSSALTSPRGGQATLRARDSPGWGCRPPLPGAPRVFVRRHRSPPAAKAGSPLQRARSSSGARRSRRGWGSCAGAGSAIPEGSGGKAEDARVEGPLGSAGFGLALLPLASARSGLDARPASTKEWRALPGQRRRREI